MDQIIVTLIIVGLGVGMFVLNQVVTAKDKDDDDTDS